MSPKSFIHEDFLLLTPAARRLYHEFAAGQPIFDYHCHLSPHDLATNRQFNNLFEIWLQGDHYKWRVLRANGVDERLVTGDADPFDKFKAWAATVPCTLRNPLYHWTHLELARYFSITELLDASSAERIWKQANERLAAPELSVHGILKKFNVSTVCTTDDPADDLRDHDTLAESKLTTQVLPAFRPDAAFNVNRPEALRAWVSRLETVGGFSVRSLADLLETLRQRRDFFHERCCRLSDHGLERCHAEPCTDAGAADIFRAALDGQPRPRVNTLNSSPT